MKEHSLIRRVVLLVLVAELVCAVCFSGVALWHEWRTRIHSLDTVVQGRSDSLLGAVQDAEDPDDSVVVDPTELKLPGEDYFAVYDQAGTRLGGSERIAAPLTSRAGDGRRYARYAGRTYRVLQRNAMRIIDRAETGGVGLRRPVTIVYAAPTAHALHEIREAAGFYVVASLVLAGGTAMLLVVSVGKLLQPLDQLALAAGEISAISINFRPPHAAMHVRELRPLAQALSDAMARLREAFEKEHRFVGDAAHELKTAVAVVRSSIQVLNLKTRTNEEYREWLDVILADNERVEELVSSMLTLARVEEVREPHVNLTDLTEAYPICGYRLDHLCSGARHRIEGNIR